MSEQMRASAHRFFQEVVSEGRLDVIPELLAEDVVEHETAPGAPEGREAVTWFVAALRSGVPDVRVEVDDLIVDPRGAARRTIGAILAAQNPGVGPSLSPRRSRG